MLRGAELRDAIKFFAMKLEKIFRHSRRNLMAENVKRETAGVVVVVWRWRWWQ